MRGTSRTLAGIEGEKPIFESSCASCSASLVSLFAVQATVEAFLGQYRELPTRAESEENCLTSDEQQTLWAVVQKGRWQEDFCGWNAQ